MTCSKSENVLNLISVSSDQIIQMCVLFLVVIVTKPCLLVRSLEPSKVHILGVECDSTESKMGQMVGEACWLGNGAVRIALFSQAVVQLVDTEEYLLTVMMNSTAIPLPSLYD